MSMLKCFLIVALCCSNCIDITHGKIDPTSVKEANIDIVSQKNGLINPAGGYQQSEDPGQVQFVVPCSPWCKIRNFFLERQAIKQGFRNRKAYIQELYQAQRQPGAPFYNGFLRREKDIAIRASKLQQQAELTAHRFRPLFQILQTILPPSDVDIIPVAVRAPPQIFHAVAVGKPIPPPVPLGPLPQPYAQGIPLPPIPKGPLSKAFLTPAIFQTPTAQPLVLASEEVLTPGPRLLSGPTSSPIPAPPLPFPQRLSGLPLSIPPRPHKTITPPQEEHHELIVVTQSPLSKLVSLSASPSPGGILFVSPTASSVFRGESGIFNATPSPTTLIPKTKLANVVDGHKKSNK